LSKAQLLESEENGASQPKEANENLEAGLQTYLEEALAHQKLAREKLEALLKKVLAQESTESTKVKVLLEAVARQKEAETQTEEALANLAATKHDLKAAADAKGTAECQEENQMEDESYDLHDRKAFAKFLIDADIRLVRGRFFKKLYRNGLKLPRRQEADSMTVGSLSALVTHEEVAMWAEPEKIEDETRDLDLETAERKAARKAKIVAVSHVWESREHADPHGYQLRKLAAVVHVDSWYFYDYMSLYQFKRNLASQEKSFKRAMANMHVLYAHEHSSTLRIETLAPLDDEMHVDATVLVYHAPSDEVKPVPVADLIANRTGYRDRGWCIAELCWSSTRSFGSSSKEIDETGPGTVDMTGQAPMPPDVFIPRFKEKLQFTHRSDLDTVLKLQEKVFHEKAGKNEVLILTNLSRAEAEVAIKALPHYRVLRRLEITRSKLADVESFLEILFKALSISFCTIAELSLAENELGVEGAMLAVRKVLNENRSLRILDLKKNGITEKGGLMLAEALLQRDVALKIELDGNDLGIGALIFALAVKCWTKKAYRTKKEQVTLVHSSVELLAERIQGIQALAVDKAIVAGKLFTFTDLCRLTSLWLHLESKDFAWQLAAVAGNLNTLRDLIDLTVDFSGSRIGDEGCQALGGEVSKLLQLTTLSVELGGNNVGPEGCQALGDGLSKLLKLTTLSVNLKDNKVGPEGCEALGDGLGKLIQLITLSVNLFSNKVGDQGCEALGYGLPKLLKLTTLSLVLNDNQIGPEVCGALGDGLGELRQLTVLSLVLRSNQVGDQGCEALGYGLGRLPKLTSLSLDLNFNGVKEEGCQVLGDGLGKCLQLTTLSLNLGYNQVGPDGCQALGKGLSRLVHLTELSLDLRVSKVGPPEIAALRHKLQHVANLHVEIREKR